MTGAPFVVAFVVDLLSTDVAVRSGGMSTRPTSVDLLITVVGLLLDMSCRLNTNGAYGSTAVARTGGDASGLLSGGDAALALVGALCFTLILALAGIRLFASDGRACDCCLIIVYRSRMTVASSCKCVYLGHKCTAMS